MSKVKLQTSDSEIIEVELDIAKCSTTIETMIEKCGLKTTEENDIIPLLNVNAATLRKVLEWAGLYKDNKSVSQEEAASPFNIDRMSRWEVEFLNVDQETLRDLMLAANYLDIRPLLTACCKTTAKMIRGKTPEELRQLFGIENDLDEQKEESKAYKGELQNTQEENRKEGECGQIEEEQ